MRIMNVSNYSTQKQNRPNFGMKLDVGKKAMEEIGELNVARLVAKVDSWRSKANKFDLMVKIRLLKRRYEKNKDIRSVLLLADTGSTIVGHRCWADSCTIESSLAQINNCGLL